MSLVAVIRGLPAASVTVIVLMAVGGSPTIKLWFAADESVGAEMVIVLSSTAATCPLFRTSSSRLSAGDVPVKSMKLRPETVIWSPAAKLAVTSRTSVWPPSS